MTEYCLYIHTNKSNGKRYVGITHQDPLRRWDKGRGYGEDQPRFYNAIQKYGWDGFEHEIRLTNLSKEEAFEREKFYISLFRSYDDRFGYNMSVGGDGGNEKGKNAGSYEYLYDRYWNCGGKEKASQYYQKTKERHKEVMNKWRDEHLEEHRAMVRASYHNKRANMSPEEIEKYREAKRIYAKQWREKKKLQNSTS